MRLPSLSPILLALCLAASCAGCTATPAPGAPQPASSAEALLKAARAHEARGQNTRARQYYLAARRAGADRQLIFERLVGVCINAGHLREALGHVEEELTHRPFSPGLAQMGASLSVALQMPERAEQHAHRLATLRPLSEEGHLFLGQYFEESAPNLSRLHYEQYVTQGGERQAWVRSRLSLLDQKKGGE